LLSWGLKKVRVSVSSFCAEVMGCVPPCYVAEIVRFLESI
jgi:hypothetical protein